MRLCVRACARAAAGWLGRVLTCATALRLYEEGLFKLEDAVSDFIPSFGREWRVVLPREDARTATESVEYFAFLKGEKQTLHYSTHVPPRCARLPLASEYRHSCPLDLLWLQNLWLAPIVGRAQPGRDSVFGAHNGQEPEACCVFSC